MAFPALKRWATIKRPAARTNELLPVKGPLRRRIIPAPKARNLIASGNARGKPIPKQSGALKERNDRAALIIALDLFRRVAARRIFGARVPGPLAQAIAIQRRWRFVA